MKGLSISQFLILNSLLKFFPLGDSVWEVIPVINVSFDHGRQHWRGPTKPQFLRTCAINKISGLPYRPGWLLISTMFQQTFYPHFPNQVMHQSGINPRPYCKFLLEYKNYKICFLFYLFCFHSFLSKQPSTRSSPLQKFHVTAKSGSIQLFRLVKTLYVLVLFHSNGFLIHLSNYFYVYLLCNKLKDRA